MEHRPRRDPLLFGEGPGRAAVDKTVLTGRISPDPNRGSQELRWALPHPLDPPLAEPPDTLLSYFDSNSSTKNVG